MGEIKYTINANVLQTMMHAVKETRRGVVMSNTEGPLWDDTSLQPIRRVLSFPGERSSECSKIPGSLPVPQKAHMAKAEHGKAWGQSSWRGAGSRFFRAY